MRRRTWAAAIVAVVVALQATPAWGATPGLTRDEFESEVFSGLSAYLGYAGNLTVGVDGSIGGGRGRFTATGLLEPDGTSELAVVTADGRRIQQLCRQERNDADDGTVELCVDRMARAGSDVTGRPWFPAAGSPFETLTAFRLGERVLAGLDADLATLRSPRVEYSAGGDDSGLAQRVTATAGDTVIVYDLFSSDSGWSVVSTRNGSETGRLTLSPAAAAIGTAYPAGEEQAPRMSVWENLQRVATTLDRGVARRGTVPTARVVVPSADAPDAVYRVCTRTVRGRPAYTVLGTQPGSPYHWRRASGARSLDVTAYRSPAPGQLPACSAVGGRTGPPVVVR